MVAGALQDAFFRLGQEIIGDKRALEGWILKKAPFEIGEKEG